MERKETRARGTIKGSCTMAYNRLVLQFNESKPPSDEVKQGLLIKTLIEKIRGKDAFIKHLKEYVVDYCSIVDDLNDKLDKLSLPDLEVSINNNRKEIIDCSICMCRIQPKTPMYRTHCSHKFHAHCLLLNYRTSHDCPNCRTQIN